LLFFERTTSSLERKLPVASTIVTYIPSYCLELTKLSSYTECRAVPLQ